MTTPPGTAPQQRTPPPPRPPALAPLLRNAALRLAHGLRAPAAGHGLTPTRLTALAILSAHAPLRVSDLARHLGTSMPSASRLLDTLVDADLAERRSDPDDQRACLVVLTPHGTDVLDDVRRESLRLLTDHLAALPDEQLAQLATALPALDALAHSLAPGPLPGQGLPRGEP